MSGGGSAPAQPSTTTQIQDIPAWEQGYVTDLLGKAQTIAAQPYQQFPGQQIAGFTPDQTQAFSNIEGAGTTNQANQAAAMGQAQAGANTAGNIYGAGAGDVNASTGYNPLAAISPYLGSAAGYNSAAAAQPWLNQAAGYQNAAANTATPQGIQNYMSPYTSSVVQGLQNEANQNWNQNIMPGVNDKFVGSGQYGSGRNAQVLGQAAGNFQTGLSANVANALESGYNTAGTQAANQASLLSGLGAQSLTGATTAGNVQNQQIGNLLNQAQAAGTATNQQAQNLQNAGTALGNLTSTQAGQQLAAGTTLGNLGTQAAGTNLNQNTALQAAGQQQQQLNQSNLNTAMQNWQNQVDYPAQQTEYLNQIIRGLPAPTAATSSSQTTPAYSVSPLSGIGGSAAVALSGLTSNKKKGGLIKSYAEGGVVTAGDDEEMYDPLMGDYSQDDNQDMQDDPSQMQTDGMPVDMPPQSAPPTVASPLPAPTTPIAASNSRSDSKAPDGMQYNGETQADMQQQQLLALAAGMLTPSLGGSTSAAFGQGLTNVGALQHEQKKMMMQQNALNYQRQMEANKFDFEKDKTAKELALEQEKVDQGKYTPIKDVFGNVTGAMDTKTGKTINPGAGIGMPAGASNTPADNGEPSADPQKAALQILDETGTPFTPVASRQDITGRNAQAKAYRDAANAAKSAQQQLNMLNAQTGKYTPGTIARRGYGVEQAVDMGGEGASARAEADKASKALANAFMQQNAGAKGSGIRMVEFDAGAVPNADMTDEARTALIQKNKAIANSQIQRAAISDMYPRMHIANVNAIMDNYEQKNPPVLENGEANPGWMPYKDWLKKGRPNTAAMPATGGDSGGKPVALSPDESAQAISAAKQAIAAGKSKAAVAQRLKSAGIDPAQAGL